MAGTKVLVSPVSMMMIHNPMTVAMGDTAEMQKAIEMLGSVKDSIINAYEIKTGLSRAKLSHLMDAETWMDANKAVELGFADDVLHRAEIPEDVEPSAVSMLYSKAAVVNSLMDKIAAKCRTNPITVSARHGRTVRRRKALTRFSLTPRGAPTATQATACLTITGSISTRRAGLLLRRPKMCHFLSRSAFLT